MNAFHRSALTTFAALLLGSAGAAWGADRALIMTVGVPRDEANARLILDALGFESSAVRALHDEAVTLDAARTELARLVDATRPEDRVFVYFSGDGTRQSDCQSAVVTSDLKPLPLAELSAVAGALRKKASRAIVLVDAGFSADAGAAGALAAKFHAVAGPTDACTGATTQEAGDSALTAGTDDPPRSALFIVAARVGETAFDDPLHGGVATRAVLECVSASPTGAELSACMQPRIDAMLKSGGVHGAQHPLIAGDLVPPSVAPRTTAGAPAAAAPATAAAASAVAPLVTPIVKPVVPAIPAQPVPWGKRVALVIGNSGFLHYPKLKNPAHDAEDMAERLRELGFTVIERADLTSRQIGSTLREFKVKLQGADVALVYLAGHGMQIKGENYFPGVDADISGEEDIPNQSLALRQLLDIVGDAKTQLNLVFLDACRDNPFAVGTRSGSRGLARIEAPSGTLISYATRPGSVARDGDGRNGLYTAQLLAQMAAAPDLPIETVLKRMVSGVKQSSDGQQEPWWEGSIEGNFCFAVCRDSDSEGYRPPPAMAAGVAPGKPPRTAKIVAAAPAHEAVAHEASARKATAHEAPAHEALAHDVELSHSQVIASAAEPSQAVAVSIDNLQPLYFTRAFSRSENGRLFRLVGTQVFQQHTRTTPGNGGLFSAAEAPDGTLYFCDATEARIFKIDADREVVVYQHDRPVKHLEFGPNGHLYFSSVMGSQDGGTIFELAGSKAVAYYSLPADSMPATWSGTFAFDAHGMLWLSSGAMRPASLYRVRFQQLEKVFTTGDSGIMGFTFLQDGSIAYADNVRSVMHLTLPDLRATRIFESPYEGWLTDVKPIRMVKQ